MTRLRLFIRGMVQVALVSAQVYLIAHQRWLGVACTGFAISYVWSHNVRSVAFGGERDRLAYSAGAACGAVAGMAATMWIYGGMR